MLNIFLSQNPMTNGIDNKKTAKDSHLGEHNTIFFTHFQQDFKTSKAAPKAINT